MSKRIISYLLLFFAAEFLFGQQSDQLPFLATQIRIQRGDTAGMWEQLNKDKGKIYGNGAAVKIQLFIATYRELKGDKAGCLSVLNETANLAEQIKADSLLAFSYACIGEFYSNQSDLPKSLFYLNKALIHLQENLSDPYYVYIVKNVALVNTYMDNFTTGNKYFRIVERAAELRKDSLEIGRVYNIIAINFMDMKNFDSARYCFDLSMKIRERLKDAKGIAQSLNNIGTLYFVQGRFAEALKYYQLGHKARIDAGVEANGIIESEINVGKTLFKLGKLAESENIILKALIQCEGKNKFDLKRRAAEYLKEIYFTKKDFKKAYEMQSLFYEIRDSLYGLQKKEEIVKLSAEYEINKRAKEDSLKLEQKEFLHRIEVEKQNEISSLRDKKNNLFIFLLATGLILLFAIAFILYKSNNSKKQQNSIITRQRDELKSKQSELLDSITYARHLQEAILPPLSEINKYFPHNFVLYKPKDIVAGDFYWMEVVGEIIFVAAADSTGHGVPGAMVSVVCSNALERAIHEFNLKIPGEILDKATDLVIEVFEKSGGDVKDGMDISLLSFKFEKNFTALKEISWAGANNPLWYVQRIPGEDVRWKIHEIKANKQPIGKNDNRKPFTTHVINHKENSTYYLFTDGYADQFGGPKGKKFKYQKLNELLLLHAWKDMEKQGEILDKQFEEWKGKLDQVDDVCVLGIRI